ncbi:MAG: acyltransferase [Parvularculaceae bacterium]
MKARLENIQALRGLAALMVLFAHVKEAESPADYGGVGTLLPDWLYMGVTGVDLFFLISGFVMVHVASAAPRGGPAARRFLFNRGARIYPVYWFVTLLLMALYAGKLALFAEATPFPNPLETFLLIPDGDYPLVPVGWTLVHEVYFYLVFSIFIFTPRFNALAFLGVWAAIVAGGNAFGFFKLNAWTKVYFNPLTFEFILGALIALALQRGVTHFAKPALILGVLIFAGETAFFHEALYPHVMGRFAERVMWFAPPYALILYGAAALEREKGTLLPGFLRKAGDASYSIYLIHVPVFLVVGKTISVILQDRGLLDNAVLIPAFFASALAAGFALHALVEKPMLKITKRWGDGVFLRRQQDKVSQEKAW